jgi:Asp-tRNA(Asn)/Glu-tRNA(Gln) amidotransferase A subunit family amidase
VYIESGAQELATAIRRRELSPVEAVDAALEHIARVDPHVNACTVVLEETARADAERAERVRSEYGTLGPLHGVPVAIKDHIWVRDVPATMGSRALEHFVPEEDSAVVTRLRDAGAIVVAKTANPEFLWSGYTRSDLHGVTRNPWNTERTPGGSSGGSGAAVASGMVPIALGSDAGGSIRIPSAFCGLAGLKPTRGIVPRGPGFDHYRTTSVIGPLARTVRDLVETLSVISGPHASDDQGVPVPIEWERVVRLGVPPSARVAWSVDLGFANVAPEVRAAFSAALRAIEGLGWNLEEAHPDAGDPEAIAGPTYGGEMGYPPPGSGGVLQPFIRDMFAAGEAMSVCEYHAAQEARGVYARTWEEFFGTYALLITPTVAIPPFAADPREAIVVNGRAMDVDDDWWFNLSVPANLTGQPTVSVPMGTTDEGLPFGVQVTARRFGDASCLAAAAAIEEALPWRRLAPLATHHVSL